MSKSRYWLKRLQDLADRYRFAWMALQMQVRARHELEG